MRFFFFEKLIFILVFIRKLQAVTHTCLLGQLTVVAWITGDMLVTINVVTLMSCLVMSCLVNTWMGDSLHASKPSWYVTSHLGQLSLPSLQDMLIEYQPFWLGLGGARSPVSGGR